VRPENKHQVKPDRTAKEFGYHPLDILKQNLELQHSETKIM